MDFSQEGFRLVDKTMDIVSEFWLHDPEQIADKLAGFANNTNLQTFCFGKSFRGRDLIGFRAGTGKLKCLVVGGLHAAELAGPFGMLAFAYSLATGRSLDGDDISDWVGQTLDQQTITMIPGLNIDGTSPHPQYRCQAQKAVFSLRTDSGRFNCIEIA